jgi:hypothetical protein
MSSKDQRENFWNYYINEKGFRPYWATKKRLEKIKDEVLSNDYFWFQVIERFGAEGNAFASRFVDTFPKANVDGSRANFWGQISERISRK